MSGLPNDPNPYQAPTYSGDAVAPDAVDDPEILKKFRSQANSLGGLWVIVGLFSAGAGILMLSTNANRKNIPADPSGAMTILFSVLVALGVAWFVLGVNACRKQLWALRVGLVLSYVYLAGNLLTLNVCPILILAVAIAQAHRVIKWGNQLKSVTPLPG